MPEQPVPLRDDGVTIRDPRSCRVCGRLFAWSGRRQFCSAACRQAAWRQRQPTEQPVVPVRTPKVVTVYECSACETRYLGEQWCPECQKPCRRIGLGGSCPHCDEVIALVDLVPDLVTDRR